MSTKAERLRAARVAAGYASTEAAARRLGVTPSTYRAHENGQNDFNDQQAARYAKAFAITAPYLIFGEEGRHPSLNRDLKGAARGESPVARVPDLAIFAGMGGGGYLEVAIDESGNPTDPDQVRGYWEFPDYMLRRLGNLRNIYAWEVRGDSMEPTLQGGSVVFVDTGQRQLPPDDIYAVDAGDGLVVKRLRLVPRSEHVEIISDNEDRYPRDRLLREEVTVWGRVIGWFQWRG